jgi:hypothetical protein
MPDNSCNGTRCASGIRGRHWTLVLLAVASLLGPASAQAWAQNHFLEDVGVPAYTTSLPVEKGFINPPMARLILTSLSLAYRSELAAGTRPHWYSTAIFGVTIISKT